MLFQKRVRAFHQVFKREKTCETTSIRCPISGHFFEKNRNILPESNANELKSTHKAASASGTLVVKFRHLELFGFFVILERVRRVGCPISGQVAPRLFPDDR